MALANARANVLEAASLGGGAGVAAASGATVSFGVKAAAAALIAAAVLGGGVWMRARQGAPESAARSAAAKPGRADRVAADDATSTVAIAPRRQSDERGSANDPSGPIATSTTVVALTKGSHEQAPADELSGVVVDSHGVPVGGARVLVFDDEANLGGATKETSTADDGTFHFGRLDAGGVHEVAEKGGVGRAARQSLPTATNLKLELGGGTRFEGRVVSETARPRRARRSDSPTTRRASIGLQDATTDGRPTSSRPCGRVRFVRAETRDRAWLHRRPGRRPLVGALRVVVRPPRRLGLPSPRAAHGPRIAAL
jgi:hypothetical protein